MIEEIDFNFPIIFYLENEVSKVMDENRLIMLKESLIILDMEIALEMTNRKSK